MITIFVVLNRNIMETIHLSTMQNKVLKAINEEHLTSFQIFNRITSASLIIAVYIVIDEVKNMGFLDSYIKKGLMYHFVVKK